jgi:rhamnulokinase
MGIETPDAIINKESYEKNFTNEGGIEGTTRFLKNICGMWLLERSRKEWTDNPESYDALYAECEKVPAYQSLINPDSPCFANPSSMVDAIKNYCAQTGQHVPQGCGEQARCIYESLAMRYRQVFGDLQRMAPFPLKRLHVIGGGSLNYMLDQYIANSLGIPVIAGPAEGTAIGNIMLQAKAAGVVSDIRQMRQVIADSICLKRYEPVDTASWDGGYKKYLSVYRNI